MTIKQYRITTQNLIYPMENDCVIDENDPLNTIKKSIMLGGLASEQPPMSPTTAELVDKFWKNNDKTV